MKPGVSSVAFGVQSLAESVNSFILSEDGAPVGAASMLTKRVGGLIVLMLMHYGNINYGNINLTCHHVTCSSTHGKLAYHTCHCIVEATALANLGCR